MKKPDNRFRHDLRKRPYHRKNAIARAVCDDITAQMQRAILVGDVPLPRNREPVDAILSHGIVPKLLTGIAREVYAALKPQEVSFKAEFVPGEGYADLLRANGKEVGEA